MPYKHKLSYFIGNRGFKTKKDSYIYCKNIIDEVAKNLSPPFTASFVYVDGSHKDFDFLCDLIKNHIHYKEKVGCGVRTFVIRKNFARHNELNIIRKDDSMESISWKDCAYFVKYKYQNDLRDAMREAIGKYCYDFKQLQIAKGNGSCVFCGDDDDLQTDHHNPSFMELKYVFLEDIKTPSQFSKRDGTHKVCFTTDDLEFQKRWYNFHEQNCNLQILCGDCNRRKKKK